MPSDADPMPVEDQSGADGLDGAPEGSDEDDPRAGAHLGFTGGAMGFAVAGGDSGVLGILSRQGLVLNVGLTPAVDFRTGLDALLGGWSEGFVGLSSVPVELRFNLGTVYTMMLGGSVGFGGAEVGHEVAPLVLASATCSLSTFRFGAQRQFEVSALGGMLFVVAPGEGVAGLGPRADLVFTWLALPDAARGD